MSLPGDRTKPNEDAFAFAKTLRMAAVVDGATGLGERLMPGPSDAQWIASFAARRLRAHAEWGGSPRDWLRAAAHDAETSFNALKRRAPMEQYELPLASLIIASCSDRLLQLGWFGDCAALYRAPTGAFRVIGDTLQSRSKERDRAAKAGLAPAAAGVRDEFLPTLRAARNRVNAKGGYWLFAPDHRCADRAQETSTEAVEGALLLLATDGFLALASDYQAYTPEALLTAAQTRGLGALGEELRAIEAVDPDGRTFPRFKRSDDATAMLLSIVA